MAALPRVHHENFDMRLLLLLLPALALILLGAHFFRAAEWPLVVASAVLLALLVPLAVWPRGWLLRLLQAALLLGSAEWLWTALLLMQQRLALGQPWLRMALILAAVAAFTAVAALLLPAATRRRTPTRA